MRVVSLLLAVLAGAVATAQCDCVQDALNRAFAVVHGIVSDVDTYVLFGLIAAAAVVYAVVSSLTAPSIPTVKVNFTPEAPSKKAVDPEQPIKDASRPGFIQCWNPSTGGYLGEVAVTSPDEVRETIKRARAAQQEWVSTSFDERRKVLKMIKAVCLLQREDICKLSSQDTGKTYMEALLGEVMVTAAKVDWVCDHGEAALAREERPVPGVMTHKTAGVEWHPLGVLGILAPWNYPFHNMYNHVISGLFAGNAVVIKPSEFCAWSCDVYGRLIQMVLAKAGHSPHLVSLVQGYADTGAALVQGGVDKVIFTGSPGVGKHIMRGAADTLTPVVLELGGKDPFVVTEGADVPGVVQIALRGAYQNCGQNCVGAERFYVYESVHQQFVDAVVPIVQAMKQGPPVAEDGSWNPVDLGASTTVMQVQHVDRLVKDAVAKGAKVLTGGRIATAADLVGLPAGSERVAGAFYMPTVLADVTQDMEIASEELFGPVMTIIKVPGDSDDAAVDMINSTAYGLGSSVFCKDVARADALASRIYTGMTTVNDFGVGYLVQALPFGGVKASGFNRFGGKEGLRECCLMKSVVSDRFAALGVRTGIPDQIAYPFKEAQAIPFTNGLIDFQFAPSALGRLAGMLKLV